MTRKANIPIVNPTKKEKKIWEHFCPEKVGGTVRAEKVGGTVRDRGEHVRPEDIDELVYQDIKIQHECCYGPLDKTNPSHWACKMRGGPRSEWWVYMMEYAHRILDVGCGMGFPSFYLASCGFEVVGVDASAGQIVACEVYRRQKGASYSLKYQVIEETKLPFDDNSFDGATFGSSLECMVEPEIMLREVIRVLKSGSPVAFDTDTPISVSDSHPLSEKWWIRVDEDVSYLRYASNVSAPYLESSGLQLFDRRYNLLLIENGKLTAHLRRQKPITLVSEETELSFEQVLSETVEGEYTEAKYHDAYAFRYLLEKMGFTDLKYWLHNVGDIFAEELLKAGVLKDMPDDISIVSRALVRSVGSWTEPPWGLVSCKSP